MKATSAAEKAVPSLHCTPVRVVTTSFRLLSCPFVRCPEERRYFAGIGVVVEKGLVDKAPGPKGGTTVVTFPRQGVEVVHNAAQRLHYLQHPTVLDPRGSTCFSGTGARATSIAMLLCLQLQPTNTISTIFFLLFSSSCSYSPLPYLEGHLELHELTPIHDSQAIRKPIDERHVA